MSEDAPKLHIDSDWKAEAQKEKEKLAAKAKAKSEQAAQAGAASTQPRAGQGQGRGQAQSQELPPATFDTLLSTMATQALFAMGAIADPRTGQPTLQLDLAKHHIDMLTVIEQKTKGNLSDEEDKALATTLYELRSRFVEAANAARQK